MATELSAPPRIAEALARLTAELSSVGIDSPEAEARWLLEAATGLEPATLRLEPQRRLDAAALERLEAMLARRLQREPLQRIVGAAPFFGLELRALEGVLIPRPETERLVELALASLVGVAAPRVHDLGCGSGAIAIAIASARPDARVSASDIDPAALAATRANAAAAGVRLELFESDLLAHPELRARVADAALLIANPPYLPEGDRAQLPPEVRGEPEHALFAGADGLRVARELVRQTAALEAPVGDAAAALTLWLELDPRNAAQLAGEMVADSRWSEVRLEADLSGRWRFLHARRAAAAPSGSAAPPRG